MSFSKEPGQESEVDSLIENSASVQIRGAPGVAISISSPQSPRGQSITTSTVSPTVSPPVPSETPILHALPALGLWCLTSWMMIITNKMLFDGPFRFPLTLMVCHTGTAVVATSFMRSMGWLSIPSAVTESYTFVLRVIGPIGIGFAASVGLSNLAAAELSVPFAQMLKAMNPLLVLIITAVAGLEVLTSSLITVVISLGVGVILTATGELRFSALGVAMQTISCFAESLRMVLTQRLLQKHLAGTSTLVALHLYATVAFLALLPIAFYLEPLGFSALVTSRTQLGLAAASSAVAFALNLATMRLVALTSGMTITVAGQFKDAVLVILSVIIFAVPLTTIQVGSEHALVFSLRFSCNATRRYPPPISRW